MLDKQETTVQASLLPFFKTHSTKMIATLNGCLYTSIAYKGGSDLQSLLAISDNTAFELNMILSIGAGLVYTMFMYKTLEALSLSIDTYTKAFFAMMAPFSASAFLTAGMAGTTLLFQQDALAWSIGILLFLLRIINCIDASVKFPERFKETKELGYQAFIEKDYAELARFCTIWIVSIGYAFCTTDAIYNAMNTLTKSWIAPPMLDPICYLGALLGALGTLPLNVYWSYRGLRQLTFGGKKEANNHIADPTDGYTYAGFLCVLPLILGILGGATGTGGHVAARLGFFTDVLRVITSIMYSCFAGTPGMATLLRTMGTNHDHQSTNTNNTPLLSPVAQPSYGTNTLLLLSTQASPFYDIPLTTDYTYMPAQDNGDNICKNT